MEWMILPYKRYFDFSGRSRRKEYWMFTLLGLLVVLVGVGLMFSSGFSLDQFDGSTSQAFEPGAGFWIGASLIGIFWLASVIPGIAVVIRRLHDRDMSGWWYLGLIVAGMIPIVGFIASIGLLVLMCLDGTKGPNRFGEDPKGQASSDVFA